MLPIPLTAGCAEFWLNRYQQLISGWLSFMLAGVAAWIIWAQVGIMERQTLQASYERMVQELTRFGDLLNIGRQIVHMSNFDVVAIEEAIARREAGEVETAIKGLSPQGVSFLVEQFLKSPIGKPDALPHWRNLLSGLRSIEDYCNELSTRIAAIKSFQPRRSYGGLSMAANRAELAAADEVFSTEERARLWGKLDSFMRGTPHPPIGSIGESWNSIRGSLEAQQADIQQRLDRNYQRAHPAD